MLLENSSCYASADLHDAFVDLALLDPSIVVDLRFASHENFTGRKLYPEISKPLLRGVVAEALVAAHQEFRSMGWGIKILDAYRPFSIQEHLWSLRPDKKHLYRPIRKGCRLVEGSVHSRAAAVDVTLVDGLGKEVEMPCSFGEASKKAYRNYKGCSRQARKNRELLEWVMAKHGFQGWKWEWWHFDWKKKKVYPLSDRPIC